MTREQLIASIRTAEAELRAEGVEHLFLFGSRARGDAEAESDLDVLIDLRPGARFSLYNLSGVGFAVEKATGIATQVVLARSAPDDFRRRIADDLVVVF
jgi:predicted nucleotidyltransferase